MHLIQAAHYLPDDGHDFYAQIDAILRQVANEVRHAQLHLHLLVKAPLVQQFIQYAKSLGNYSRNLLI